MPRGPAFQKAAARDLDQDLDSGLKIIAGRSDALSRFMSAYARLAKLPAPRLQPLDVGTWVQRVVDDNWPAPMELDLDLDTPPLQLRLAPTARSRLR